jgi:hypothetical protein
MWPLFMALASSRMVANFPEEVFSGQKAADLLRNSLKYYIVSLLPHSIEQNMSQSLTRYKGREVVEIF